MESLGETKWDVLISGTGFAQSLLALALSRSNKKVLHIDRNDIYGGGEAALSLQDAEKFRDIINKSAQNPHYSFESAKIVCDDDDSTSTATGLRTSRSYSLSLSPQLVYTQSALIPVLVSSHIYQTLEFQAVGNWWIAQSTAQEKTDEDPANSSIALKKIPSGREDVFADDSINRRSKMALMKFLRHLMRNGSEDELAVPESTTDIAIPARTFAETMATDFHLAEALYQPLLALALSPQAPSDTPAGFAMDRINRHIRSIGVFGPGFGSLIVKWGGLSEIAQASCRALAVGGGVYILGQGIEEVKPTSPPESSQEQSARLAVSLTNKEVVDTQWVVGGVSDVPDKLVQGDLERISKSARAIYVVSSPLDQLFAANSESGPPPAGILVVFPTAPSRIESGSTSGPIYLIIHSSDTGECPNGQCVIYASSTVGSHDSIEIERTQLDACVQVLLENYPKSADATSQPRLLWAMHYVSRGRSALDVHTQRNAPGDDAHVPSPLVPSDYANLLVFQPPSLDLAFDDNVLEQVKAAWKMIMGDDANEEDFMKFQSREEMPDE